MKAKDCAPAQSFFLCKCINFPDKNCAICLLTNQRAAGSCPGPLYYTTNPRKSQAQNHRQCAQTLTSRIVQPAGAAGVGRHSPSTRPTQFSAHMLAYGSLLLIPISTGAVPYSPTPVTTWQQKIFIKSSQPLRHIAGPAPSSIWLC